MDTTRPHPANATPAVGSVQANSRLTFEPAVLEKIAGVCAQDMPGILGMDGSMVDTVAEKLGRDAKPTKGITATVGETQVSLEMTVILAYDTDAQAVFDELCTKVQRAVLHMTGLQLIELNLHVQDVLTRREWRA